MRGEAAKPDEVIHRQVLGRKFADGDRHAVQRAGWYDHIDTAAVGQARIHQRLGAIDFAAQRLHDVFGGAGDGGFVFIARLSLDQLALALDVDLLRAVDHHLTHTGIAQVFPDRPVTDHFVRHGGEQDLIIVFRQARIGALHQLQEMPT